MRPVWGDTHVSGGALMRKRIFSLLATTMVVFAACNGASTSPSPSSAAASQPAASSGGESSSPGESSGASAGASASAGAGGSLADALFNTKYKPVTDAQPGGTLIMGEWQPPDTLQPFFSTAYTTVEATTPVLRGFAT